MTNVRTIPPELPSRVKAKAIAFCTNLKRHDNAHQAHEATRACVEPSFLVTAMRKTGYFRTWSHSTTAQEITNFQMPRNSRHSALDIPCWFSADPFWMEGVVVCSCWWGAQLSTLHKKTILPIKGKSKTIYCVSYHLIVLNFSDLPTTKNDEFTCSKTWQDKNLLPSFRVDSWHQWNPWCIQSQNHHMPKGHEHVHHPMGWSTPVLQVGLLFWWKKNKGETNRGFQSLPVHPSSHHILRQWVQQANCPGSKAVWFLLEILWLVSKQKRHLHLHTLWISLDYIVSICLLSS